MYGIVGILSFNLQVSEFITNLKNSITALKRSNSENINILTQKQIGLANIVNEKFIDKTPFSNIIFSDDKKFALIFEGRIFNSEKLKEKIKLNNTKKLITDSELILYLLIEYGESIIGELNGNFVFGFYNFEKDELLLARDHLGINTLLYYHDENKFIFASELKALLEFKIPKIINSSALFSYFQLNYVLPNISIIQNVNKLEPGKYLKLYNNKIELKSFYKLSNSYDAEHYDNYELAKQKLRTKLENSIEEKISKYSDCACFLSGGIDSTIVTAIASKQIKNLKTFSIGFENQEYFDETQFAQIVAKKYKTKHTTFKIPNKDLVESISSAIDKFDEPYADSSALALNVLSLSTSQFCSMVLSGDGADELFGGYNKHAAHFNASYAGTKEKIATALNPLWKIVPKSRNSKMSNFARQLDRFATGFKLNPEERYWFWATIGTAEYAKSLLKIDIDYSQFSNEKYKYVNKDSKLQDLNNVFYTDMNLVIQGDMLLKTGTMSRGNRIEIQSPFLDKNIVDYVFTLPPHYKITSSVRKRILKDSCNDLIPAEIINRSKHGFEVPLLSWFRKDLKHLINSELLSEEFINSQEILNFTEVQKLKQKINSSNPEDSAAKMWALIVFQSWWKKYM